MADPLFQIQWRPSDSTNDILRKILNVLNGTGGTGGTGAATAVDAASDRVDTFTYLDAGTSDERVSTIVSSSASLGLSYTTTFTYAGSAGAYRVATVTKS